MPGVGVEKGGALLTQVLLPHTQPKPWKKVNGGLKPVFYITGDRNRNQGNNVTFILLLIDKLKDNRLFTKLK